ncbi:AAA+ ATPase domain-containing protein [Cynara cardunculus var. scolymus]|uniref:ATP-dependent zinc metalloprotease FTSH, chloroplastic n=1 Tax=Cynara cardunculus var. scolymus TaxID=59895 RepID=A0A124SI85_CYNCS|nr:AAA+ ATPase domain-containing protein [Cynara cardunculus var. scolymus]
MAAVETLRPIIHGQIHANYSNYHPKYSYRYTSFRDRFRVLHENSNLLVIKSSLSVRPLTNLYRESRVSNSLNSWGGGLGFLKVNQSCRGRNKVGVNNSSCEHDTESSGEKSESESNKVSKKRDKGEKKGKGGWGWGKGGGKWRWQPIIQAQEIGVLLLQLGIVMFVMRLLRPGLPLPGSEPRVPTMFVSVPYSDFLNKVGTNQVQKVEVDGVHIMFKLKQEQGTPESEINSGSSSTISKMQDSELLLRTVAPTKRIVYTTTRPNDIKTPYEKMLENDVEFGSPDKRSGGFLNSALVSSSVELILCSYAHLFTGSHYHIALFYVAVLAGLLHRFPVNFSQHTAGQLRNRKSGGSGGSKVSEQGEAITFSDVAGVDEAKEELEEIVVSSRPLVINITALCGFSSVPSNSLVFCMAINSIQEFLRNPERYIRLGARPPRGVLLVGLPGTGKTLLAKAVAGEAEVPFISCSASEFVELYVGMGASRVRDLFARAKKEAPSIIFIDEIDAVAKSRDGKFRIVSNDEREQTLNQLLTEMDGFDSNSAVIVLGATNRADVLDPALRRPGRFDRVVMVETPDRVGRNAILNVHVSKKELPLGEDVDLANIASMTTGFTGADLANLVNEAALLAGRQNKVVVEKMDFIQAVERSIAGIEKKTAKLQGTEKAVVARHEAGHAVVGTAVSKLLSGQPRVEKLSILPRSGGALGFTYTPPTTEDRYLLFVDELRGRLVTLLGGRAAEEIIYSGRVSTGALDDIRRATDMAYKAIAEYGLNRTIGPISLATLSNGGMDDSGGSMGFGRDQGHLVDLVQREVKLMLQSALDVALSVMQKEKVEGEELQEWLKLVVAPEELADFVRGTTAETFLPLQSASPELKQLL